MKRIMSKKSQVKIKQYTAGILALFLGFVYSIPGMASCQCCDSMNAQPVSVEEVTDASTPSCHSVAPTSDGSTEEISSCHSSDSEASTKSTVAYVESNGCGMDCMSSTELPAPATLGLIESHSSSCKVHSALSLSELVTSNSHVNESTTSLHPHQSALCPIHISTATVSLRI